MTRLKMLPYQTLRKQMIKFVNENKNLITFLSLHLESTEVVMFFDANLSDSCSPGGHMVFISDKFNMPCPHL